MLLPVLTYLFHRIDQRLDGRPTIVVLDEAWVMLMNGTFGAKVEEWLRTLRKKNAAVILATQSVTEVTKLIASRSDSGILPDENLSAERRGS